MKQWFRMTVFAAFTSVMSLVSSVSGAVVAYWDFSSDSNGVTDVSGNYNTLVNNGVVISNGIAVFNGSHAAFNTASSLNLTGKTKLTVEFFMRTTTTEIQTLAMQGSNSLAAGAFYLDINDPGLSAAGRHGMRAKVWAWSRSTLTTVATGRPGRKTPSRPEVTTLSPGCTSALAAR